MKVKCINNRQGYYYLTVGKVYEAIYGENKDTYVLRNDKNFVYDYEKEYFEECNENVEQKETSNVNHPNHYNSGSIEVIDYIDSVCGEQKEAFYVGNIIKYISRYKNKNGSEDIEKAIWYANRLNDIVKKCK